MQSIIVIFVTLASNALGFLRDLFLSRFYGAGITSDAFVLSFSIPTIFFSVIGYGISVSSMPIFAKIYYNKTKGELDHFTSNILNLVLVCSFIVIITSQIFIDPIIDLFAPGFSQEAFQTTKSFLRVTLLSVIPISCVYIFKNYLNFFGKVVITIVIGIPLNLIIILGIWLSYNISVDLLPIGIFIGYISQSIILWIASYKIGYRYFWSLSLTDNLTKSLLHNIIPVVLGALFFHFNTIIGYNFASKSLEGGVSFLTYASRIFTLVEGLLILTILSIYFPRISKVIQKYGHGSKSFEIVKNTIFIMCALLIPSTIFVINNSYEIIQVLFGRGKFSNEDIIITSDLLKYYIVGIIGYGIREVVIRIYYASDDYKTPLLNSLSVTLLNLVICYYLYEKLGLNGIALSLTISYSISFFIVGLLLFKRYKVNIFNYELIIDFSTLLLISLLFTWISQFLSNHFDIHNDLILLIVKAIIFSFLYVLFLISFYLKKLIKINTLFSTK